MVDSNYPTIFVRGKISFCRIASLIEGQELMESNKNSRYPSPNPVPHTSIALYDAEIMNYQNLRPQLDALDPQLTQMLDKKLSPSREGKHMGHSKFNVQNKTTNLPTVFQFDAPGATSVHPVRLEHELAQDQEVTLAVRTFNSEKYNMPGATLESVLIEAGEIKYYIPSGGAGSGGADLSALGITVSGELPAQTQQAPSTTGGFGGQSQSVPGATFGGTPAPAGVEQPAPQAQEPAGFGSGFGGGFTPAPAPQQAQAQPQAPAPNYQNEFQSQTFAAPAQAPAQTPAPANGNPQAVQEHLANLRASSANTSAFGQGQNQAPAQNQAPGPWDGAGENWNQGGAGINYQPQQ